MREQYLRHIENQAKVKVAERTMPQTGNIVEGKVWFVTLAAIFAGVFYFWGYYFWGDWWRALIGG